ncbi:transglutaminase domain-containing protein [Flavobacterium magnum]|nr:transglutaminase domain-containing protein [Flavobacterium magnum]
MKKILPLLLLLVSVTLSAQKKAVSPYAAIDAKALQIPDSLTRSTDKMAAWFKSSFATEKDRTRAAFIWIAKTIHYDLDNMFALNFYEKREEKIDKALKTRKGICANYAELFADISNKMGIKSYVVEGYTKQNGFTDYIPHAWCAAFLDGSWYLYDPTWGSGYVNGGKFIPRINNAYYETTPKVLAKSHMPFDYLWQFMNYPITTAEFYQGKTDLDRSKPFFDYPAQIAAYEKLDRIDQLKASAKRIEETGLRNSMIFDRLQHIRMEIDNDNIKQKTALYNEAVHDYNAGINETNAFIEYRNKQFKPTLPDGDIEGMLIAAESKLNSAVKKLEGVSRDDEHLGASKTQLLKTIQDALKQVMEFRDWLHVYFGKSKSARKGMFYEKRSLWSGK